MSIILLNANDYVGADDILAAAAEDFLDSHDMDPAIELSPRWGDDEGTIVLTVPQLCITEDDDEEELEDTGSVSVVSRRRLMCGDSIIAEWSRCARGRYRGIDWVVTEDTEGGQLPDWVSMILEANDMEDEIPYVPEPQPTEYDEVSDGCYAVYWESIDEHVVARYDTLEAAQAVADEKNRELDFGHPGDLRCAHSVRVLDGDEWVSIDEID
jgi:hypothetical protein